MKWRVIPLETHSAAMNMAIDGGIVGGMYLKHMSIPTIRFYKWKPSAVSLGFFQCAKDELDLDACHEHKVDIVRRRTGGGAVFHWNKGEITYSVITPVDMMPKDIIESYKLIGKWIIDGLKEIGINAEFKPINDIVVNGKKISGNAQTRRRKVFLQHGTILYDVDPEFMFTLLKVPDEKIRDKLIASAKERVTSIKAFKPEITEEQVYEALLKGFTKDKEWEFGKLTEFEKLRAQELHDIRYNKEDWNFQR